MKTTINPSIYVACLSAYNNGFLHGCWIDLTDKSLEEVWEKIMEMLKASPMQDAEEWAIHDYQGFEDFDVSESHDLEKLVNLCELKENLDIPFEIVAYLANDFGIENVEEYYNDNFIGIFKNDEEFAMADVENHGYFDKSNEFLERYFDYDSYAKDLLDNSYIFSVKTDEGKYYFYSR